MVINPNHNISADQALDMINNNLHITNAYIQGDLAIISKNEDWRGEIVFDNCVVENFDGMFITSAKPVRFTNSHFNNCQFRNSFFLKGLIVDNCTFDNYLDLQSTGYLTADEMVIIRHNSFSGFVNFFDSNFKSNLIIEENIFEKGTNINSKTQMITFDNTTTIQNNIGETDIEAEID